MSFTPLFDIDVWRSMRALHRAARRATATGGRPPGPPGPSGAPAAPAAFDNERDIEPRGANAAVVLLYITLGVSCGLLLANLRDSLKEVGHSYPALFAYIYAAHGLRFPVYQRITQLCVSE